MNSEKFRRTGEFSDITIIVDKTEFKLHTFPLLTRSEFFKKAIASSTAPYVVRLDNQFPGGASIFNQLVDYFYSIPVIIDQKNLVPLRAAASFVESEELGSLLDKRLDELLRLARAKFDLNIPLTLLEQCTDEYQPWAKQTHLIDKCLQSISESLSRTAGIQINKIDRNIIIRLPVEWIIKLIELSSNENKFALLPLIKHYINIRVLEQNSSSLSEQNENDHQSAFTPIQKKENIPITTDQEKRAILDQIVKSLGNYFEQLPLSWLQLVYEKSLQLQCECQSTLSSYLTEAILQTTNIDNGIDQLPDEMINNLLERVNKHKEEHFKDPQLLFKLTSLIDSYVMNLRQKGKLSTEQFMKLATCIPKEQRDSHDILLLALDEMLRDETSTQLSENDREQLLNQIDFTRINEETINVCKNNKMIPQKIITEAALALSVKLRRQLDETRNRLTVVENELGKSRTIHTTSSYRSRNYDSPLRSTIRSRMALSNNYDLPLSSSMYTYSRYEDENDIDNILSSRYAPSSFSRYGTSYYSYRH